MTIVMGLDQHRAQITAEWIDTDTGEISRARVAPADREAVRRFLERFATLSRCLPAAALGAYHAPGVASAWPGG